MKKFKLKHWLRVGGESNPASKQEEETKPVEWILPKLYKPARKKKLPTLESIVKQRIVAGIASYSEKIAYLNDYLWEEPGQEALKEQLLAELKEATKKK